MSGFYKKKHAAASHFWQENGFYALLVTTLVLLCVFAWILSANPEQEQSVPENDTSVLLPENAVFPDISILPDPNNVTDAGASAEQIPADEMPDDATEEPDTPPEEPTAETVAEASVAERVIFTEPVSSTERRLYSGVNPVFSETMNDWRTHEGMDYLTEGEEPVLAVADGIVEDVYSNELMGVTVVIRHSDDTRSVYQSLAENPRVLKGSAVKQGDMIGRTGNTAECECLTGNHLHFAVLENGSYVDPVSRFSAE